MKKIIFIFLFLIKINTDTLANAYRNAEDDFETFWTTFRDNYAFFSLKGIDWDETYKIFRPQVTKKTTQNELIAILAKMVEPLNDGHISISKGDKSLFKGKKKSAFRDEFGDIKTVRKLWKTSYKTLIDNGFSKIDSIGPAFQNESLFYFSSSEKVGYIKISRCFANLSGIMKGIKEEKSDSDLMLKLFDEILSKMVNTEKLIIDLRANPGGHSGEKMAARFALQNRLTHYKTIRKSGGYEQFTEFQPIYLTPNVGINYQKPIIILTNDKTASSAEDFAISLYEQPNVKLIGTNTSGMFSDIFIGKLSKKIEFGLSNQRYYNSNRQMMEGMGVPVNVFLENKKKDIQIQSDPLIIRALEN